MKDIEELNLPEGALYAETHEWARAEGELVRVGISDYAQDNLGDLTFVELPSLGDRFDKGEQFGSVESTKAVSELFMPIAGEIAALNTELAESPGLVNSDPYGAGWIVAIKADRLEDLETLMNSSAYREMLRGLE